MDPDPIVRQEVALQITNILKTITVNGNQIHPVITSDKVEMTQADCERLAKQVLPVILRMLQVPGAGGDR